MGKNRTRECRTMIKGKSENGSVIPRGRRRTPPWPWSETLREGEKEENQNSHGDIQ